jgi:hypothetical protein
LKAGGFEGFVEFSLHMGNEAGIISFRKDMQTHADANDPGRSSSTAIHRVYNLGLLALSIFTS